MSQQEPPQRKNRHWARNIFLLIVGLIAVAIGLAIGLITNPGAGTGLTPRDGKAPEGSGSWIDFLTGIVPTDVITPFTELKVDGPAALTLVPPAMINRTPAAIIAPAICATTYPGTSFALNFPLSSKPKVTAGFIWHPDIGPIV